MRSSIAAGVAAGFLLLHVPADAQTLPGAGASIGIQAGYGWGSSAQRDQALPVAPPAPLPEPLDGSYGVRGGSIGLAVGYGVVFNKLLFGIDGDLNWARIDGQSTVCGLTHRCGTELDGYGTLRGRIGTYLTPATLLYATGGAAVGKIHAFDRLSTIFEGSKTRVGWTIGGGFEQQLFANWSVKFEYLYMDFGRDAYFTVTGFTPERVDLDLHTLRLGLTYSLGGEVGSAGR